MQNKWRILVFLAILVLALATPASATTYSFTDTTQVQQYRWTSPTTVGGDWMDVIGPDNEFAVPRVDFTLLGSDVTIQLWENFPQAGISSAVPGVLAFDTNGDKVFDAGIALGGANAGKLFTGITSWLYTVNNPTFNNGNWYYGGKAGSNADSTFIPYTFSGGTNTGIGTMTWVADGSIANYLITISLPGANSLGQFDNAKFLAVPGDCGNGAKGGQVPIPASALLLGTGLFGIGLLRFRRHQTDN